MANIKSAQKRMRQQAKRHARNKSARSRLRSEIKKYRTSEGPAKSDRLPGTYSEIDHARKKGVIHPNAAARYKSRLAKAAKRGQTPV
ncbi:MAG TPA: 30S ribosomal protein S20 [Thermoanaerobaculia bacterium]|jgi:small subunit ribosomal protein S20|nr:30S ribosomal protein S20 [Thermoanaerobaculia bacterium]